MFTVSVFDVKTASSIFRDMASQVVLPGEEGQLCILDFHQPIISCLKEGKLTIDNNSFDIKRGIARMQADNLVILVER